MKIATTTDLLGTSLITENSYSGTVQSSLNGIIIIAIFCISQTFVKNHHKVGVIRVREGQRTEEEIFSNIHQPGPYDEFLNLLGTCGRVCVCVGGVGCVSVDIVHQVLSVRFLISIANFELLLSKDTQKVSMQFPYNSQ